jgi:YidC/Oxa1 family membrane protein insertase
VIVDRRSIIFVLLSTVILFAWMAAFPPSDQDLVPQDGEPQSEVTEADKAGTDSGDGETTETNSTDQDPSTDPAEEPEEAFSPPHRLLSLGSLAEDSRYRLLVTLNSRGAVVEQAELTDRLPSGQFRFKQVDDRAGYLGYLALQASSNPLGVEVQVVGEGTPAALAESGNETGLKARDVIVAFNQAATLTPDDYFAALNATQPGEKATLEVIRDGVSMTFTTELLSRPMKVIQPLPKQETDMTLRDPESLLLSLGTLKEGVWREIGSSLKDSDWEVLDGQTLDTVQFRYRLTDSELNQAGLKGPVSVIKTYHLAEREVENEMEFDKSYHVEMNVEIRNEADEAQTLALSIDGPTGLPDEGWWYINKIHGRSTALFYTAGARDVIGSSQGDPYVFLGGPEIYSNAKDKKNGALPLFPQTSSVEARTVNFAGVDTQYFNVSLIPNSAEDQAPFVVSNAYARPVGDFQDLDKNLRKTADISFRLTSQPLSIAPYQTEGPSRAYQQSFTVFAGPKYPELLEMYGLESTVSYGWFAWFSKPLVWLLHLFYAVVGNYGVAIIMLTILVRAAMIPISRKAALNAQMMQHLQPEMKRLNEQYKNDMEKRAQAQRDLFRRYNYNPAGGCLLMFVQLPIFLGLYRGLNVDIALRGQPLIPGLQWCSNLAGPDRLFVWESWLPFLTAKTGFLGPYFNILPIITVVLFLVQQKLFMPPAVDEQTRMTQKMMTYMMVFMGVMFFRVPSGLCIYFITSSTWGIVERKLLPKPSLDGKLARLEASGSMDVDSGPKSKSAAQSRIEEQRQRNRDRKRDRKDKR